MNYFNRGCKLIGGVDLKKRLEQQKMIGIFLFLVVLTVVISGCSRKDPVESIGGEENLLNSLQVITQVHKESVQDEEGEVVLIVDIDYPQFTSENQDFNLTEVNAFYKMQYQQVMEMQLEEAKELAFEDKKIAEEIEIPFNPHGMGTSFTIGYNDNGYLSVMQTNHFYTGGAHPNYFVESQTFDLKTGKMISLTDVLGLEEQSTLDKVYEFVLAEGRKRQEEGGYFYDEFESYAKEYYSINDFALKEDGLLLYYQIYAIAPYAAGLQEFIMPYSEVNSTGMEFTEVSSKEEYNQLIQQGKNLIGFNQDVLHEITPLKMLPMDMENPVDEYFFPVVDERFNTLEDLKNYLGGIYSKDAVEEILKDDRYKDMDGKLYGDIRKDAGGGYYVDFDHYTFEMIDQTGTTATLKIFTKDRSPEGETDITFSPILIKENNNWLLQEMIY
jgi:hypothetical protein